MSITILSGNAKFKGAEGLQDNLKRTLLSLSGRYYLHPKDRGKGRLAGKETIKGTFLKTPSSALYGFADSRPLPAALSPRLHPPGADRAADTRRSGRGLSGRPWQQQRRGKQAKAGARPQSPVPHGPARAPSRQPLRSEKARRKIQARRHPSLRSPRLSVRQSGCYPRTGATASIPAELRSARAPLSPGHGACRPPPNPDLTAPAAWPHPGAAASAKFLKQGAHLLA